MLLLTWSIPFYFSGFFLTLPVAIFMEGVKIFSFGSGTMDFVFGFDNRSKTDEIERFTIPLDVVGEAPFDDLSLGKEDDFESGSFTSSLTASSEVVLIESAFEELTVSDELIDIPSSDKLGEGEDNIGISAMTAGSLSFEDTEDIGLKFSAAKVDFVSFESGIDELIITGESEELKFSGIEDDFD